MPNVIYWPTKLAAETVDYGADWAPTLSRVGDETITDSAWALISGDVTVGVDAIDADARGTSVRISGGTANTAAVVRNTVTLSDGQVLTTDAHLKVR